MIIYSTNQRRAVNWTGSNWQEEVLSASGVEVDAGGFNVVSGAQAQEIFQSLDNELNGFEVATASGIVIIDDVSNVSGTVGETLENIDVITLGSSANSIFRFSFAVPAQPVDPVHVRVYFVPRTSGSGNVKLTMDYNIFDLGDDLTPGSYALSATDTVAVANEQDNMKLASLEIPTSNFNASGSAPYLVNCRVTRDISVSGNYSGDTSIVQLYADNIPGGITGQSAGYVGGALTVDGDLTVEGTTILQGGAIPATSGSTGVSGSLVLSNDFIYVAVATNQWKRVAIANF